MASKRLAKLFFTFAFFSLLCAFLTCAKASGVTNDAMKGLPERIGGFRAQGAARPLSESFEGLSSEDLGSVSGALRVYQSVGNEKLSVTLIKTRSDSSAYALLTYLSNVSKETEGNPSSAPVKTGEVGTASISSPGSLAFFKGATVILISGAGKRSGESQSSASSLFTFGQLFAQTLESEENDVPVLVKHLPDWETAHAHAAYAVSLASLKKITEGQPVIDALNFVNGTEAIVAPYGESQLAIIEYATPQIAADNDARVKERIEELRGEGKPLPTAYRRVGNYSVFVFNAPNTKTAEDLIGKVHYEQLVQWLGDNPRALQRAQKEYVATTAGLILAVLKASGLAVIMCLGVGGIFGGIIFMRRRAQQTAAYTDAGGLMRLNIDDLTAQTDSTRLIGKGSR